MKSTAWNSKFLGKQSIEEGTKFDLPCLGCEGRVLVYR